MDPGWESSTRIMFLMAVPTVPAHAPKMKYSVPISLWLVENSHRSRDWIRGFFVFCRVFI